jgi:hypothetical protein
VYIPYVKSVSGKLKHIENHYDMSAIFKMKHNFTFLLMKTVPKIDPQQAVLCVYSILCQCDKLNYETDRTPAVRFCEQTHDLKQIRLKSRN